MSTSRKPASFWKIFAAAGLGALVVGLIVSFILMATLTSVLGGLSDEFYKAFGPPAKTKVKDNSVLKLDLNMTIKERQYASFSQMSFSLNSYVGLYDIIQAIEDAKKDPKIEGILLDVSSTKLGLANAGEIREAITDFKSSGKFVYAYGKNYTQKSYYIASVADKVMMYPTGHMEFKGLSTTVSFYKEFLDKFNLEIQVIRGSNNRFKSAVEPFLATEMSESNRLQTERFLNGLWDNMLSDISESRGIDKDQLQLIADSLLVRNGKNAVDLKLLDELVYPLDLEQMLLNASDLDDDDKPRLVHVKKYMNRKDQQFERGVSGLFPNIAIVYASGSIHGGKSDPSSIGDETLVKAIKEATEDPFIKAIVLRVNSPGGDALASDLIWDALVTAKEKKPVVVSMGDVAASGGYYISCMADKIFADPNTITGSIGVFLIIPHTGKFFENDLGIHYSRVKTAEHADMSYLTMNLNSFSRPLTEEEKKIFQQGVDETYHDFLSRVDEGRSTFNSTAEVDSIGQGRVWSGTDALEIGLVDTLGSLKDAIDYATNIAKIDNPVVGGYPRINNSGLMKFLQLLEGDQTNLMTSQEDVLPVFIENHVEQLKEIDDLGKIKASMLWRFDIE